MNKSSKGQGFFILLIICVLIGLGLTLSNQSQQVNYTYRDYLEDLTEGKIARVIIRQNQEAPTGRVSVVDKADTVKTFNVVNTETAWQAAMDAGLNPEVMDISKPNYFMTEILPMILIFVVMFFMFNMMMNRSAGGGDSKMMNFGKSRAKMTLNTDGKGTTFKEVAGVAEEKEELAEIVDFLKNPKKYIQVPISMT